MIRSLAWEFPYAEGAAIKIKKKKLSSLASCVTDLGGKNKAGRRLFYRLRENEDILAEGGRDWEAGIWWIWGKF